METEVIVSLFAFVGVLLSLAMNNLPVVKDWFGELSGNWKRGVVIGLCLVAGAAFYAGNVDLVDSLMAFISALIGTQTGYSLLPKE